MPLKLVRADDARTLWETCSRGFLDQIADTAGPQGFAAHLWLAQQSQVDLLYATAHERGISGWLGPPITTLRQLADRFDIRARRLGLLTRRRLIGRVAGQVARDVGLRDPSHGAGIAQGHMLDALFGELLPEGVGPERLAEALDGLGAADDFARRRSRWVVGAYRAYLSQLQVRDRIDARQTNAMIAEAIEGGALPAALAGARTLHVYGVYMMRSRQRLLTALARQSAVDVRLYALTPAADDPELDEWGEFAERHDCEVDQLPAARREDSSGRPGIATVQPAPDTEREAEWVARQVKRLVLERGVEPHRVAVVARSGHEDTGRMHRALTEAGVAATTLVRARLTQIAAFKALLALFRGAAAGWTYRTLRPVLDNTLFDLDIDLRTIDYVAHTRRVEGLDNWEREIGRVIAKLGDTYESGAPRDRDLRGSGLFAAAVARDLERFRALRPALESLSPARPESDWIELTLSLLRNEHPAALDLRRRLCRAVGERWDVVRLDQRGVHHSEGLLREWLDLDHPSEPLTVVEWRQLLERMLEANELSITTPEHKGVQVLEAHDAAMVPFEHVFVVHANDGVFPRRTPSGGVLSNDERASLRRDDVPLSWRDLELRRERALWRCVTSSGKVVVTYRSADAAGTPLLPSLLVPEHDSDTELPRTRTRREADDPRFVPVTARQADQHAAVVLRESLDRSGAGTVLHPGTAELLPHAVLAAVAESYRDTGEAPLEEGARAFSPSPWNGWLRDPQVLTRLGERFDDDYPWSASQLEAYSKLPFQFLLDRVLRYEEAAEADEEVTPLVFGWMAHDLLEKFYARLLDDLPSQFGARAEAAFEAAAEEVLAAAVADERWLGAEVLWEQQWKRIRDNVRTYLEWELGHLADKHERPRLLEYSFGFDDPVIYLRGDDVEGNPARLRLRGRIDRVDEGDSGFQVLDYKSGGTPGSNDYDDGSALQAPLYMQVLEDAGYTMAKGYYRSLKPGSRRVQYAGKILRDKPKYIAALTYALSIPGRVRAGLFEPVASVKSGGWAPWHAGREIARSRARLTTGNRYTDVQPVQPAPAPAAAVVSFGPAHARPAADTDTDTDTDTDAGAVDTAIDGETSPGSEAAETAQHRLFDSGSDDE